jgi:hypothetical protein
MYYENVAIYYSENTKTEEISTSGGMGITYDFLPGKDYAIRHRRGNGKITVEIVETDLRNNSNGVYFGSDMQFMNIGLATTPFGYLDFELGTQRGFVFDPGISFGIYADLGVVMGVGYPWVWAMGFYGGGMFETLFNDKFGLAFGGGYRLDLGLFSEEYDNPTKIVGPYIRGGLKFGRNLFLYGDIYFQNIDKDESHLISGPPPYPYRNWGIGIKGSL